MIRCAEFLSGQAHALGLTNVYPMECSCGRIIEIAKDEGIWVAVITKLVERGILKGIGTDDLGLTDDLIRMLTINDRAGVYD